MGTRNTLPPLHGLEGTVEISSEYHTAGGMEEARVAAPRKCIGSKKRSTRFDAARERAAPFPNAQERQAEQEAEPKKDDERLIVGPEGLGLAVRGGGTTTSSPTAGMEIEN